MKIFIALMSACILFISINLSMSAKSQANELVDLSAYPKWFRDSLARETTVKTTTKLENKDLGVSGTVKGELTLAQTSEDYWYYSIEIGTTTPVECHVFTSFDGPANSTANVINATLPSIEKLNNKALAKRINFALDVGVSDDIPYFLLDTLYTLGKPGDLVSGLLKSLSARTGDSLHICLHNETGYSKAFEDVFTSFIAAMKPQDDNSVFFEHAYKMTVNGVPMGFAHEKHALDQDGDVHTRIYNSMIIPTGESSISKTDTYIDEFGVVDGSLINAYEYSVENGELVNEFSLSAKEDKWHLTGQVKGEAVANELVYDEWLLTTYGTYLATSALLNSEDKLAEYNMWVSEENPLAVTKVSLSKIENNEKANIQYQLGSLALKYSSNTDGTFSSISINQGGVSMEMTPLFKKGSPTLASSE